MAIIDTLRDVLANGAIPNIEEQEFEFEKYMSKVANFANSIQMIDADIELSREELNTVIRREFWNMVGNISYLNRVWGMRRLNDGILNLPSATTLKLDLF